MTQFVSSLVAIHARSPDRIRNLLDVLASEVLKDM